MKINISDTLIDGVEVNELKVFRDKRGAVMRMMRNDDPFFREFGEIYFSIVNPTVVKAWHLHKTMTLNYACVFGMIKLVLYDPRAGETFAMVNEIILEGYPDFEHYKLVTIPPGVWNGFRQLVRLHECPGKTRFVEKEPAIVANCATEPHHPDEIIRLAPKNFPVAYDWGEYEVAG